MSMKLLAVIVIFVTNFRLCQSQRVKYDNYTLFSVHPQYDDHLKFLQDLQKQKYMNVKFWSKPFKLNAEVQLMVNPMDLELFLDRVKHFNLPARIMLQNVQSSFDSQIVKHYVRLRPDTFSFDDYHSLEDINQWMADLATKYPNLIEVESIGKSAEGRDIYVMLIQWVPSAYEKVIVEGGMHGNEWISPAFVTYLAHQLIHAKDSPMSDLLTIAKKYRWYLIPVVNPDGYLYSQNMDRLWRKNRRFTDENSTAVGVDLNRNFDYAFGKHDTSSDPQDDYYCGPHSFSEPETVSLSEFIDRKREKLKFYFSYHGYGQKFIIPYSDRVLHLENYSEMENYARQAILKMNNEYGNMYGVGTAFDVFGTRISGDSASWVKRYYKVKYVFTFLLRDNGTYGFALPSHHLRSSCQETLTGLIKLMTAGPRFVRTDLFDLAPKMRGDMLMLTICILVILKC